MDALEKQLASCHYGHEIWFINANGILTKNNNNNCTTIVQLVTLQ